jgi:hypothetical protein
LLQTATHTPITQWNPLTLQGAGLFHIAMGAVLGIAAFGRTQEKLNGANNGGMQPVAQSVTTTYGAPQPGFGAQAGSFSVPASSGSFGGSFGSTSTTPAPGSFGGSPGFGAPAARPAVGVSSSGKPMPAQPEQPEI